VTRIPLSTVTRTLAAGLLTLGLIPLFMVVAGIIQSFREILAEKDHWMTIEKYFPLLILLASNTAIVVWLTLKAPVFSSMKASYFLSSLPAFGLFTALGVQLFENRCWPKFLISFTLIMLVVLTTAHVMRIAWDIKSWAY